MYKLMSNVLSWKISRAILGKTMGSAQKALDVIGGRKKTTFFGSIYAWGFVTVLRLYMASLGVSWKELKGAIKDPGISRCFMVIAKSLVKYGLRIPLVLIAPFSVVYNLTNKCNLRCKHCFQSADNTQGDLMTKEQKFKIIDEMAELGTAAITFSGGEPLMSPDFWDCAKHAFEKSIYVSIDTNGTLIDDSVANKLVEFGVRSAQVSIDSPLPELHDDFRCMKGAFELSMKGVTSMKKVGIFVTMGVTLTSQNVDLIDDFVALAKKHDFNRIVFYHLIPVGRGQEISDLDLKPKIRAQAMEKLAKMNGQGIEILSETPHYEFETAWIEGKAEQKLPQSNCFPITAFFDMGPSRRFFKAVKDVLGGCPAGRLYCNIQPNGDLTPCMFSPFDPVVGNLTKQSFQDAWDGFKIMWDRSKLTGFCGDCEHAIDCGGCRARAVANGDLMGPDYGCYVSRYFKENKNGHRGNKKTGTRAS